MGGYSVERSITINASSGQVHGLVEDFRSWTQWSPWEDIDPHLARVFKGPQKGVGARYEWSGNRKAGAGSMEIIESDPTHVDIDLRFDKPFRSTSLTRFSFAPSGDATTVTWAMTGEQRGVMALFGKVFSMDRMVGPDFEKGLARLKGVAEETPA